MRRPSPIVVVLTVVAGLVGLAVVVVRVQDDGSDRGLDETAVVVIGDSVVEQSSEEIAAEVGGRVSVIGLPGHRIDELLPTVRDAVGADRDVGVAAVMAGYNDVWQGREREAPIDEMMDALAGSAACPIWVLVPTKGDWDRDRARAFDRRVREAAEAAGVAVEARWRDAVDAGDDATPDAELVSPDLVHPTAAGQQRLAEVVADAATRRCG